MSSHAALDYGFARRHGVLRLAGDGVRVALREGADPMALLEARRVLGQPIAVQALPRAEFDRRLSEIYAGDALQGGALASDAGDTSLDDLAGDLPASADLLDDQDDAPVIRLINGLIAEAARGISEARAALAQAGAAGQQTAAGVAGTPGAAS